MDEPVGFGDLGGDFGEVFGGGHPDRHWQADLLPDQSADLPGDLGSRTEEMLRPTDVEECLVYGDLFDIGCEPFEDLHHLVRVLQVALERPGYDLQLRAQAARLVGGHRRSHAEGTSLVAGGEDHPRPHRHRDSAERWVEELLDGGVERIQIGVEDVSSTHVSILADGWDIGARIRLRAQWRKAGRVDT